MRGLKAPPTLRKNQKMSKTCHKAPSSAPFSMTSSPHYKDLNDLGSARSDRKTRNCPAPPLDSSRTIRGYITTQFHAPIFHACIGIQRPPMTLAEPLR